jgi:hypothetical protein
MVDDDANRTPPVGFKNSWRSLVRHGYALTDEQEIGLTKGFRETFLNRYFNDSVLRHDEGDWPVDLKRARDVVRYQWQDGHLYLWEHEAITVTDRADVPGKREHARVWLLDDLEAEKFVRTFLSLVPPGRRQNDGTFGVICSGSSRM